MRRLPRREGRRASASLGGVAALGSDRPLTRRALRVPRPAAHARGAHGAARRGEAARGRRAPPVRHRRGRLPAHRGEGAPGRADPADPRPKCSWASRSRRSSAVERAARRRPLHRLGLRRALARAASIRPRACGRPTSLRSRSRSPARTPSASASPSGSPSPRATCCPGFPRSCAAGCDAVVSNPPYIPSAMLPTLPAEVVGFEPHLALDGGPDGLDVFRRLAAQAAEWLAPGGRLVVELDESRVQTAGEEALEWYEEVRVVADLAGRDRILAARRPARP